MLFGITLLINPATVTTTTLLLLVLSFLAHTLTHSSLSVMFDEASDINMNSNLNVFVNILLKSGDVKTLTLSLVGIALCYWSLYSFSYKCILNEFVDNTV